MSKFRLSSDFKPTGDQPAAIAALTKGLQEDMHHQTLLGVTGSGKSVIGSSKVLVARYGTCLYIPIEQLSTVFSDHLPQGADIAQAVTLSSSLETLSLNTEKGDTAFSRVTEVSRHTYEGDLYTVESACGRSNQFTDSHNVYVLRDGCLKLIASKALRVGDWLPVPDILPANSNNGISELDLRQWLPGDNFYVALSDVENIPTGTLSQQKLWRVRRQRERIRLADYRTLSRTSFEARLDFVGTRSRHAAIPLTIGASRELWRFIGLFIAEGHAAKGCVLLSTADPSIAKEFTSGASIFGLKIAKIPKSYDYQVNGRTIAALMRVWCGHKAQQKHLPSFWPQCTNAQLGEMLSGIFAGDGWVEPNTICLLSSSRELIFDVQCALLRFGIHGRVRIKKVTYKGTPRDYWLLSIYGKKDLATYRLQIGFGLDRKDAALEKVFQREMAIKENTNVDLFPLPHVLIRQLCADYGLLHSELSAAIGVSRSLISLYLSANKIPSRHHARNLLIYLRHKTQLSTNQAVIELLDQLISLTNVVWSPIRRIEAGPSSCVVYDLSVPGHQTFLAGEGGYFVHNTFTAANIIQNVQR
ncbi:MAG TPA: LAGLIDADG family homing endonuclease, partial [Candidatus Dormibacteraeota bacterium]|nr:LAGLIDADG family homing endonuclease [Candidatus Dormibacteraeota bacterium]